MRSTGALGLVAAVGLLSCGTSFGQDAGPPPVALEPVLAGPKVGGAVGAAGKRTLVRRTFNGDLERLDVEPAQAALELLELDRATRRSADRILNERAAIMDKVVIDNLKEIVELAGAFQAGEKGKGLRMLGQMRAKLEPLTSRGSLLEELAAVLPPEQAAEMGRLVKEYMAAAIDDRMKSPEMGKNPTRLGAVAAESLITLGQEVKRSYERTIGAGAKDFEALIGRLNLDAEQESKVRQIVGDLFQRTYGKPTKAQQVAMFLKVYAVLDRTQRKTLTEAIGEEARGRSAQPSPGDSMMDKPAPAEVPVPAERP